MQRKNIICYGDSNTFGYIPQDGRRYPKNIRWTGVLQEILNQEYKIIEEGCNNRTAFFKNPDGLLQSGGEYLEICLDKYPEFNYFIFAAGTNDVQKFYDITKEIVRDKLNYYINLINKKNPDGQIILVTPIFLNKDILYGNFSTMFDSKSIERSHWIQDVYQNTANENNIKLFDINQHVAPSHKDGLHFEPNEHKTIAEKLKQIITL